MKKPYLGTYIIASALIWGIVIIGCGITLKGTECFNKIKWILNAGVVLHTLFIWSPIVFRKLKTDTN